MPSRTRNAFAGIIALYLTVLVAPMRTQADGQSDPPPLPRCAYADAQVITRLDSAVNTAGDAFIFKIVEWVAAQGNVPAIPANTRGYGIVSYADHAHGAGQPGRIVVEPRFLALVDGTHVPVMADPQLAESFVEGESRNLNGALGFVPGIGLAVGGYNALHRGHEVVIEKGAGFRVILGDALATGGCYVPPPSALNIR